MQSSIGAMSEREERRFVEIPRESVRLMAESTGLELSDEVAALLAEDVCYRLREATQLSIHETHQTAEADCRGFQQGPQMEQRGANTGCSSQVPSEGPGSPGIPPLLRTSGLPANIGSVPWSVEAPLPPWIRPNRLFTQAVCGYGSQEALPLRPAREGELYFPEDREVNLVELALATNIPKGCAETAVRVHVSYLDGKGNLAPQGSVPSAVSSLTDDLLKYYQQVTRAVLGDDPQLMKVALQDLQTNSKIAALLPYFVYVVSGVKSVSHDLEQLHRLLQVARSLVRNPHLCLGPYVRSLVGSVLYCVLEPLAASINPLNDHWTLRDGAALLLSHIFWTHGDLVSGLYQQILLSLQKVLADPVRPLCSHYGAVVGLHALGWKAVERVLYPHLSTYWTNLQAVLDDYSVSNAQVKADGHKVYGAILVAVERLLKMKAHAAEPNKGGPGSRGCRRSDDLPWDSLLLQESPSGGSAEPGFGSGLPLPPGGAGPEAPSASVTLADIYRELYAFFGDSLATRFGTGQPAPTAPRPPGDKKEPAAAPDSVRKMPQLTANAMVSPQGDESPRGGGPPSASAPAASESRPLPRVHRARGAPRQQGPGAGTRDVFQKSRFAPRGAPHFRFIIAGRQAGRRCRGRLFQTAFPAPYGPSPASRYVQKLPMIGRTGRPARRWALSDYSLYLPL
ncbi:TAF6-like RNA polymerase II p300/CBP-associated factor-associated factor 65 kDa subunit 6L isoform X2 [Balaenoptera musculus]|uniref:TAF6-like RNA polymerase II p300/CBP-associated factor-associated factor 65 kDa subunit 6L isoform X2 n=1 Tax=Balaenoptera musculus TaxID=9771 RepID=A0A8B8Y3M3_BALMU|nr:TAF6-like RNA polymerase II p300/CBP-associated factor-associated factor 65 kDa subunit 6L isoform X2 [Balaenoptera musculus]XP_036716888.1 TAF6-like RNA polymerase II p300/CBP-associated factor-associated factor 65 kDa subunit 6L isoform X2 [Balaenoptera musculus]XP_036716889.1 TAF6-like RNA polymerase II p300/CBP-associated factor-associated factor 65 kDa subunit 6L isoform X2 [Balaenoptera musculus]